MLSNSEPPLWIFKLFWHLQKYLFSVTNWSASGCCMENIGECQYFYYWGENVANLLSFVKLWFSLNFSIYFFNLTTIFHTKINFPEWRHIKIVANSYHFCASSISMFLFECCSLIFQHPDNIVLHLSSPQAQTRCCDNF